MRLVERGVGGSAGMDRINACSSGPCICSVMPRKPAVYAFQSWLSSWLGQDVEEDGVHEGSR